MLDWQAALSHAPGPADVWPLVAAADARGERVFAWRDGASISVANFCAMCSRSPQSCRRVRMR